MIKRNISKEKKKKKEIKEMKRQMCVNIVLFAVLVHSILYKRLIDIKMYYHCWSFRFFVMRCGFKRLQIALVNTSNDARFDGVILLKCHVFCSSKDYEQSNISCCLVRR